VTLLERPDLEDLTPPEIEVLFGEARQRRRRRRLFASGGLVVALSLVLLLGLTSGMIGVPSHSPMVRRPASPLRITAQRNPSSGVTTAYVVDVAGLVPVDLGTDRAGQPITIPGFSFSGSYSNVAIAPDGTTAYVVTSPTPTHAGPDMRGPALVTINLLTRRVVGRISFLASAVQPGQDGPEASFYIDELAITPNGRTLLVADAGDNALIPIDVATHNVGDPIALPPERPRYSLISNAAEPNYSPRSPAPITDLVVNPDGRTAYLIDGYAVVPVDLVQGRAEEPITGFDGPQQMAISSNGRTAYVTNPYCWEIINSGQCEKPPTHPISEPNGRIQLASVGSTVSVVDLADNRVVRNINLGKWANPMAVALSPTGSILYITFGKYGTKGAEVAELEAPSGKTTARIPIGLGSPNTGSDLIAISPDGNEAFVSGFDVVTPGPDGPVVFRGVVPINLRTRDADRPISFGVPVTYGLSTGSVLFGK
jgi:DNA-binding beta-propeller fold protein YncE